MQKSLLGLLQTVKLIHNVSQFYNTSERTSALMVKVRFLITILVLKLKKMLPLSDNESND